MMERLQGGPYMGGSHTPQRTTCVTCVRMSQEGNHCLRNVDSPCVLVYKAADRRNAVQVRSGNAHAAEAACCRKGAAH